MEDKNKISAEDKKSLQDFAVAYFFVFRIQLENAEIIEKTLHQEVPKNSLLTEFAYGYISGAVTEFVLFLYDTTELLKKATGTYKYRTGGAMEAVFKFRRNVLAHRRCNWGSEESKETINFFSQGVIYKTCYEAANEFVQDLRGYISFDPIEKCPSIQKIRGPDLNNLLSQSPELKYHYAVPDLDEVEKFFGTNLLPGPKKSNFY